MPSPEYEAAVAAIVADAPAGPFDVASARENYECQMAQYPLADGVEVEPITAGGVAAEEIVAPSADPGRCVLFLHGGGYVNGSIATHRQLASRVSQLAGARVVLLGQRLAPEHPFPAALDDATAAFRWLWATQAPADRVAVAGDSAGGGLALAMLRALSDAGDPLPRAAVLMSPWTDLELTGASVEGRAEQDPVLSREMLAEMARDYLAGHDPRDPLVSPLHADLHGFPPLLIQVGTADILMDDSVRLAAAARSAAVPVELDRYEGLIHVFQQNAADSPEAAQALARVGEFLARALG